MKHILSLLLICLVNTGSVHADGQEIKMSPRLKPYITFHENTRIYVRNDDIVIRTKDLADGKVIINDDFDLLVNGEIIDLNENQQKLVFEYYQLVDESMETAKKIGWEGAKVGVQGAAVGLKAVAGVFRMILPNYGPDDLERDMEEEAAKIEAKADELEEKAEIIEEKLDTLEILHDQLRDEIPELEALGWF